MSLRMLDHRLFSVRLLHFKQDADAPVPPAAGCGIGFEEWQAGEQPVVFALHCNNFEQGKEQPPGIMPEG